MSVPLRTAINEKKTTGKTLCEKSARYVILMELRLVADARIDTGRHDIGDAENAGIENAGPRKIRGEGYKMQDWKTREHHVYGYNET